MRLIDADAFIKRFHDGKSDTKSQKLMNSTVRRMIREQPTAYDVDAVVEQLEERTSFLKDCTKYGNQTTDQQSKSYDTMMMYEVKDLVDDLLEIVKGGGADDN